MRETSSGDPADGGDTVEGHTSRPVAQTLIACESAVGMGGLVIDQISSRLAVAGRRLDAPARRAGAVARSPGQRAPTAPSTATRFLLSRGSNPMAGDLRMARGDPCASAWSWSGSAMRPRRSRNSRCSVAQGEPRRSGGRGRAEPAPHGRALERACCAAPCVRWMRPTPGLPEASPPGDVELDLEFKDALRTASSRWCMEGEPVPARHHRHRCSP